MGNWLDKYEGGGKLKTANTLRNAVGNVHTYFSGKKDSNLIKSNYRPTKGDDDSLTYYTREGMREDVYKDLISPDVMKEYNQNGTFNDIHKSLLNSGTDRVNNAENAFPLNKAGYHGMYNRGHGSFKGEFNLGRYRVDAGKDKNGKYISFNDTYDWDGMKNLGKMPIHYYDRIYEQDWVKFKNPDIDAVSYEEGGEIKGNTPVDEKAWLNNWVNSRQDVYKNNLMDTSLKNYYTKNPNAVGDRLKLKTDRIRGIQETPNVSFDNPSTLGATYSPYKGTPRIE